MWLSVRLRTKRFCVRVQLQLHIFVYYLFFVGMIEIRQQEQLLAICNLPSEDIGAQCQPEIKDSESEWEDERNALDFMENL